MSDKFVYNMNTILSNPFEYDTGFTPGSLARANTLTQQMVARDRKLKEDIKNWEEREARRKRLEDEVRAKRSGDSSKMAAVTSGEADFDSAMVKMPTPDGFVWRNYDEAISAVSRSQHMNNTTTLFGPNEFAYRNRFYGTSRWLDVLEEFNKSGVEDARQFLATQDINTLTEDPTDWRIIESMIGTAKGIGANAVEFAVGEDPSWGATRFTEGGEIYQELYEVDPNWQGSEAMESTIANLLDPETSRGQMFRMIGLKEEDIRRSPNMLALSVILNKKTTDYEAGQAAAEMTAPEKLWQFVADTGVGMVTDPDTVAELGFTALTLPFTFGGSAVAFGARQVGKAGVRVAARAPRMAAFYKAVDKGGTSLAKGIKAVGSIPKKYLPTTLAEQLIVPAIARATTIKKGLKASDEIAEMAKQVAKNDNSLIIASMKKAMFNTDITPGTFTQGLVGNMIDGAVGELFAYGLSREEEYMWNRFVSGEYVDRDQFNATWSGYAASGLQGMGFGAAIGGAMRIGSNILTGNTGTGFRIQSGLKAAQETEGGVFNTISGFTRGWRDSLGAQREATTANQVAQIWADATGRSQIDLAKSHVTGMARKNGVTDAQDLADLELMVDYAWSQGVDLASFSKAMARTDNLKDLPKVLNEMTDTVEAKRRATAIKGLNAISATAEGAKLIEKRTDVARKVTERQITEAVENNTLISETNSLKALKQLAEEGDEDAKAYIEELKEVLGRSSRGIVSFLVKNRGEMSAAMLTDIANGMLIRQGREALTPEERVRLNELFQAKEDRVTAIQEEDEARYQKTLETGMTQKAPDQEKQSDIEIDIARKVHSIFESKFDENMKLNDPQGVHAATVTETVELTQEQAMGAVLQARGRDAGERRRMAAEESIQLSDARVEGSVYNVENMISETKARLDQFKKQFGIEIVDVEPDPLTGLSVRGIAGRIMDDFGIDTGLIVGDEAGVVKEGLNVSRNQMVALYNQLKTLKQVSSDNPKLIESQTRVAKELVEGITAMLQDAAATSRDSAKIDIDFALRYMPPKYENLLTNIFERYAGYRGEDGNMYIDGNKAYDVALSIYDDAVLGSDILNRTREEVAAEDKGSPFILVANRYYHGRSLRIRKGMAEAEVAEAVTKRAEAKFERNLMAVNGNIETSEAYMARHEKMFVEGILDGWSDLAPGPTKDALARKLGIYGLVTRNNELFAEGPNRNKARTEADAKEFAARINEYYKKNYGLESTQLINGTLDAADGYTVGRAMIEAVSPRAVGTKAGDSFVDGLDNAPTRGWLGTGSTSAIQKIHEDAVRDQVVGQLFFEDGLPGSGFRKTLDTEEIFAYYDTIEQELQKLKAKKYPEAETEAFIKKYLSETFYEPYRQRYFTPQQMFRQVEEQIGNFRQRVEERTKKMANANPAIVKTLHDEVAGPRSFFGQLMIVGNIIGGKDGKKASQYLDGLSGDMGLEGAAVMPGSFKQAWQIRNGKMFGTTQGLSKLAAVAGLKDFSDWADGRSEEEVVRALKDLDAVVIDGKVAESAVDASAQAVTAAQSLYRDWAMNNWDALDEKQRANLSEQHKFTQWLKEVRPFLNQHGGLDAMAETLVKYGTYTTDKGADNYSKVGFKALEETKDPSWLLIKGALEERLEDGSTSMKKGGTLGNFLRKEIFKPPVMTLPYSAGMRAFYNAISSGLDQLKADPEKFGFEGESADAVRNFNTDKMAREMAASLFGDAEKPGLIQTVLDIPRSPDMVKNLEQNNALTVVTPDGNTFEITGRQLANGTWEGNPTIVEHMRAVARKVFSVEDPATQLALGEWYVTMMYERKNNSNVRANIDAEIEALKKFVQTPPEERGSWDAVSSYIGTAELAGRAGYIAVEEQVNLMMEATGLRTRDLSNEALVQLMGKAVYFPKGTGFSRAFAGSDTAQAGRDMSTATEGEEASPADGGSAVNVGQFRLVDWREGMVGPNRRAVSEADLQRAVIQDEILNASSIFQMPNSLRPERQITMDDLIGESMDGAIAMDRELHGVQVEAALAELDNLEQKRRELEKKGEELSIDEARKYAFIYQMKKMLIEEKDDGSTRVNANEILVASDRKASMRLTQPEGVNVGKTHPTKLGIPALREIQQKELAETTSVSRDGMPITVMDMVTASPYSPEKRQRAIEDRPEIPELEDDTVASAVRGDDKEIKKQRAQAEIDADQSAASENKTTRSAVLAFRMNMRADKVHGARVGATRARVNKGEADEGAMKSAVTASEIALAESLRATFGLDVSDSTTNLNYVPTSGTDIVPGKQGATAINGVRRFAARNRKHRMLGLALGAVNHAGLRLANPKIDTGTDPVQRSNEVAKQTSRGPASIFYRDWSLMGGAQSDAVANMIDYAVARMDDNLFVSAEAKYAQVKEEIAEKGVYQWWADTRAAAAEGRSMEAQLEDLANFTEANLGRAEAADAIEAAMADFNAKFERGLQIHGINPRTAVDIDGEEKMLLVSIIDSLSDPEMMRWFKQAMKIEEDITPEEVAAAFASPDTQKKLMFLRPYEKQKGEDGDEVIFNPFGDIVNGQHIVDPQMTRHSRPVFTEMNLLNLLNATGNRRLMRRIVLANEFGVDIPMTLTGSQSTANPPQSGFDSPTPPVHGLYSTPRNEAEATLLKEGVDYDGEDAGELLVKRGNSFLKNRKQREINRTITIENGKKVKIPYSYFAVADTMIRFGLADIDPRGQSDPRLASKKAKDIAEVMLNGQLDERFMATALYHMKRIQSLQYKEKARTRQKAEVAKRTSEAVAATPPPPRVDEYAGATEPAPGPKPERSPASSESSPKMEELKNKIRPRMDEIPENKNKPREKPDKPNTTEEWFVGEAKKRGLKLVPLTRDGEKPKYVHDYDDRFMVIVEIKPGVRVPFYVSTGEGGKDRVPAGRWYPFFGIGEDGWLNKVSQNAILKSYGSKTLRDIEGKLDDITGDNYPLFDDRNNGVGTISEKNRHKKKPVDNTWHISEVNGAIGIEGISHQEDSEGLLQNVFNVIRELDGSRPTDEPAPGPEPSGASGSDADVDKMKLGEALAKLGGEEPPSEGASSSDADVDADAVAAAMARLGGKPDLATQEAEKPIEQQRVVDTETKKSPQGKAYLRDLIHMWESTGDVMWKNQINAFKSLTEGPDGVSDVDAIFVLESSVKNDKMRRAWWGGGDINMIDSGDVQMRVGFGSDIKARLEGLAKVKKAINTNHIPAAVYVLMHELGERVLAVVQYGPKDGRTRADSLRKLRNQVMRDFIDDAGWTTSTRKWLVSVVGENVARKVGEQRDLIMKRLKADQELQADDAVKAEKQAASGYKNVSTGVLNKMANAVSNLFTYAAGAGKEGMSAIEKRQAATELMAQWLTIVAYRRNPDGDNKPGGAEAVLSEVGPDLKQMDDDFTLNMVNDVKNPSMASEARRALRVNPDIESSRADTTGHDDTALRGAVAFAHTDGMYFKQMEETFDMIADRAINIYEGEVVPEVISDISNDQYAVLVRPLGGKASESAPIETANIDDLKSDLGSLETGSSAWMKKYAELKRAESALYTYTGEETMTKLERFNELDLRAKTNEETGELDDVADLRRLSPEERTAYVSFKTDRLMSTFDVAQSGRLGSAYLGVGTFLTATPGALEANTSPIMAVRSLAAMLDTTNFNTESTVRGYVPMQMAVDKLQSRFAGIREVLGPVRNKIRKLRKNKSLDNLVIRKVERVILAAVETGNFKDLQTLNELSPKEKAAVEQYHHKMMNKDTGFIRNLIDAAEQDGMLNSRQAANLRAKPRLPYQLDRAFLDDSNNFTGVRKDVRLAMVRNQLNLLNNPDKPPVWDANMAKEAGVIYDQRLDDAQFRHIAQELDPKSVEAWKQTALALGLNMRRERWEIIKEANEVINKFLYATDKKAYPPEFMNAMGLMTNIFRERLIKNESPKIILAEGRAVTPSQYMKYQADIRNKDTEARQAVVYEPDVTIGMYAAHRVVQNWRNGGYLRGDSMLFKDPRTPRGASDLGNPDWLEMQVSDVSVLTNGLFGSSRLIEAYHGAVNQPILGAKGLRFEDMYYNLLGRIKGGEPIPVSREGDKVVSRALSSQEQRVAITAIKKLKDQYDSGIGRLPEGVEAPSKTLRNINALIRIGTSVGSAPNWAISSLAETTQLVMQTMMRTVMLRDLKSVFDFVAPLDGKTRRQLYESVNMFHNQYDRHNIGIQTGQYFLGDITDLDKADSQEQLFLEKADGWLRWVGTLGFGQMNRYNRYVGAARSARDLRRLASKTGFLKFNQWLKENPDASVKEAIKAGRPMGITRENVSLLTLSGFGDESGQYVADILRNMTDHAGVRWADVERGKRKLLEEGKTSELPAYQKAATLVSTLLQQKNQMINLEPRMGSKSIPKNVTEAAIASLTQFPVLALMNIRRMAKVGGISGVSTYLMYLIMGDTVYEALKEVLLKGETPESIMDKWEEDPYTQTLNALQRSALMGGPVGGGAKDLMLTALAQAVRAATNDTMGQGFMSQASRAGGNVAGLSMFFSSSKNFIEAFDSLGDTDHMGHNILSSLPAVPARMGVTYAVGLAAQNTPYASMFSPPPNKGGGGGGRRSKRPAQARPTMAAPAELGMAPPRAQSGGGGAPAPQAPQEAQGVSEGLSEKGASGPLADKI